MGGEFEDFYNNIEVNPSYFELYPSKLQDITPENPYLLNTFKYITFNFKNAISSFMISNQVTNYEEISNIQIKFHIEHIDFWNDADNNVYGIYNALINGREDVIPRPVGYLDKYQINLGQELTEVKVCYTASDISGIYKIVAECYYKTNFITNMESIAKVWIPNLVEVPRIKYELFSYRNSYGSNINEYRQIWNVIGETEFHNKNNYLQYNVIMNVRALVCRYIIDHLENYGEWFIFRINDMSLPWGGMFWIGYIQQSDLTINRINGFGSNYTITYRAGIDHRIYAPPHRTHRDGINVDISFYSDDGYGKPDFSKEIDFSIFYNSATNARFDVFREGDHYHLEYVGYNFINYF